MGARVAADENTCYDTLEALNKRHGEEGGGGRQRA